MFVYMCEGEGNRYIPETTHIWIHTVTPLKIWQIHLIQEGIWLSVNFLNVPSAPHDLLHENLLCLLVEVLKIGSKSHFRFIHTMLFVI